MFQGSVKIRRGDKGNKKRRGVGTGERRKRKGGWGQGSKREEAERNEEKGVERRVNDTY